jgi:preprotein translocase subunit SecY
MIIAFSMLCGFLREQVAPAMPAAIGKTLVSICDPTDFSYYVFLFVFCIAGSYIDVQNTPKEVAEYITKIGARIPNVRQVERKNICGIYKTARNSSAASC